MSRPVVLVLSACLAGCLALVGCGDSEPTPSPVTIRVLDADGKPLAAAVAYALGRKDAEAGAASWKGAEGTLELPPEAEGSTLLIAAPGHLVQRVEDVRGTVEVVLPPGHLVRLQIHHEVPLPEPPIHVVMRIRPTGKLEAPGSDETPFSAGDVLDWMSCPAPAEEAFPAFPRRGFGFAVSQAQAAAGVHLPLAGRYSVQWGLFDTAAGTWYTLAERTGIEIGVDERREAHDFKLRITKADLELNLEKLRESIERQRAK